MDDEDVEVEDAMARSGRDGKLGDKTWVWGGVTAATCDSDHRACCALISV